jgi:hypothetical protein
MGSIMTHWYAAKDLLIKIVEYGIPYTPSLQDRIVALECMRLRWIRSDEDGNLTPTPAGLSRYEKIRILGLKDL